MHQPVDQILGFVVAQWRERDEPRPRPWRRPRRAGVEEIWAREAEQEDRRAAREAEDVLEQVEQRRLGPVDVVDGDDERSRGGERLEEPAKRPRRLLRRARLVVAPIAPTISRVAIGPRSTFARSPPSPAQDRLRDLAHDLGEREVGDPLAVRDAAPDDDARVLLERARSPLARGVTFRYQAGRRSSRASTTTLAPQSRMRGGARRALEPTDERRDDRSRKGGHVGADAEQPPAASGSLFPFARQEGPPRDDCIPDEVVRRLADQHLARLRSLFEPRSDVDRVAGRELLVGGAVARRSPRPY